MRALHVSMQVLLCLSGYHITSRAALLMKWNLLLVRLAHVKHLSMISLLIQSTSSQPNRFLHIPPSHFFAFIKEKHKQKSCLLSWERDNGGARKWLFAICNFKIKQHNIKTSLLQKCLRHIRSSSRTKTEKEEDPSFFWLWESSRPQKSGNYISFLCHSYQAPAVSDVGFIIALSLSPSNSLCGAIFSV